MTDNRRIVHYLRTYPSGRIIVYIRSTDADCLHPYQDIRFIGQYRIRHFADLKLSDSSKKGCFHCLPRYDPVPARAASPLSAKSGRKPA